MKPTQYLAIAGLTLVASQLWSADCKLLRVAEMPVTLVASKPMIAGTINGKDAVFLADSGAFFSLLKVEAAEKYGLTTRPLPENMNIVGVGGRVKAKAAGVKELTINGFQGSQVVRNLDFVVAQINVVPGADGIVGQNILGIADIEYDLANGKIRLFRSQGCGDKAHAYWHGTTDVSMIEIEARNAARPHFVGPALLNGKKVRVMIDSGAGSSALTLRAARRAGITPESDQVSAYGISGGLGKKTAENFIARFDTFDIGGEMIRNARLRMRDVGSNDDIDMLLGMDFFLSHRIYVSIAQDKMYFTYNGGPVFDLGGRKSDANAPATSAESAGLSAADLRLRGIASAGRRDFAAALADLDQAIKLDATDAETFYRRGIVRRQNRQPLQAMADFTEALRLKPEFAAALVERGSIRVVNNLNAAQADFDAAAKLEPNNPDLGLRVAQIYAASRHFDMAITQLDGWIAAYPKDGQLPTALGERCRARILLNKELDQALADCDAALKSGPRNSASLATRALLMLRRGELDASIKDFSNAVELQPKDDFALYGLGVAQSKQGLRAQAEKNMQAATAIDPNAAEFFKRFGFTP
jgi:predicted aspartyl protease/tetratricopeptide (TPR) repeat protein